MMDASPTIDQELAALESGALDLAKFPHRDHVRLAFHMLERYPLGEAITRFAGGLKLLTQKIGKPEVYHETVTVAFLAVIGERRAKLAAGTAWEEFIRLNPDLLEKDCLQQWYSADVLGSDLARRTFILPRR